MKIALWGASSGDFSLRMRREKYGENSLKQVSTHRLLKSQFHGGENRLVFRFSGAKMAAWCID